MKRKGYQICADLKHLLIATTVEEGFLTVILTLCPLRTRIKLPAQALILAYDIVKLEIEVPQIFNFVGNASVHASQVLSQ